MYFVFDLRIPIACYVELVPFLFFCPLGVRLSCRGSLCFR